MNHSIILASKSPRRQQLLFDTGLPFTVECSQCEEYIDTQIPIAKAIEQIAYKKAETVLNKHRDAIVIGADTMVCIQDVIMGKPKNTEEAMAMLMQLSGKTHQVITGVAIVTEHLNIIFHETTYVTFYDLENTLLHSYIASNEPYDKAGAYGIQGRGKLLVKEIRGDYYNVVGLPIARVYRNLLNILYK